MIWIADEPQEITVIASREDEKKDDTASSVTLVDAARLARIGSPLAVDYLRLVPTAAVSTSGPAGSLTEVRIRGAEADHTLLFVDGIRVNDPAAGNAPRFELLNADLASRIEVVRGPQSALWGSEAIGGVVAVSGPTGGGSQALAEAGSFDTWRGAARVGLGDADNGLSVGIAAQRSNGVDSFDGHGDRDGYSNRSVRASGRTAIGADLSLDGAAFLTRGTSEYDGYVGWVRGDTLDESHNRLAAGRVGLTYGRPDDLLVTANASLLGSRNAYYLDDVFLSAAEGTRRSLSVQAGDSIGRQRFILAAETERETFKADVDARRRHHALTAEWRGQLGPVRTDVTVRRDFFSAFDDATSVRSGATLPLSGAVTLAASYGEGIAQPTFYDLFGYPGFSVGNPNLKPERSRGGELSLRYARGRWNAAATLWKQRLTNEIVADYSGLEPTTANLDEVSHRRGLELEAGFAASDAVRLSAAYAWLDADEPNGGARRTELRRPRHSGQVAVDGQSGRWAYGAMLARTGAQHDVDYDLFLPVKLPGYWLANAQVAYRALPRVDLTGRVANAFDRVHEDVVGYRSEGRSVHGGIRVRLGD
jgi:vitamin B12 transporter